MDSRALVLTLNVDAAELAARRAKWTAPAAKHTRGVLGKFYKLASSASFGAVLDRD
jgi:dihydroxy-acid dehydratase